MDKRPKIGSFVRINKNAGWANSADKHKRWQVAKNPLPYTYPHCVKLVCPMGGRGPLVPTDGIVAVGWIEQHPEPFWDACIGVLRTEDGPDGSQA